MYFKDYYIIEKINNDLINENIDISSLAIIMTGACVVVGLSSYIISKSAKGINNLIDVGIDGVKNWISNSSSAKLKTKQEKELMDIIYNNKTDLSKLNELLMKDSRLIKLLNNYVTARKETGFGMQELNAINKYLGQLPKDKLINIMKSLLNSLKKKNIKLGV